jgi:hypothetical protein
MALGIDEIHEGVPSVGVRYQAKLARISVT